MQAVVSPKTEAVVTDRSSRRDAGGPSGPFDGLLGVTRDRSSRHPKVVFQLPRDELEIYRLAGIDVDQRPETERPVGSQLLKGSGQILFALVSIQMPFMALAGQETLGCYGRRTGTVSFDELSRQGP
jgi:hypothetical protein